MNAKCMKRVRARVDAAVEKRRKAQEDKEKREIRAPERQKESVR